MGTKFDGLILFGEGVISFAYAHYESKLLTAILKTVFNRSWYYFVGICPHLIAFDFVRRWDDSFSTEINLSRPQVISNLADGGNLVIRD